MIKDITIGQYFPGESYVHKLDARVKLAQTFAVLVAVFLCRSFIMLGVCSAFVLVHFLLTALPARLILKSFKPIIPIIILTSLLQLYYNSSGETLFEWHFIHLTTGGLSMMAFIVIRILLLIFISSLLTYTTSPTELTDAIESLLSPLKIFKLEVHTFAMMMTIALRFIPTLLEETDRLMNAQKARGADFETGSPVKRAKALFPIFVPLFVSSFKRAYELADAMSCRCYTGSDGRTRMKQVKIGVRDIISCAATGALIGLIIWFDFFWGECFNTLV